MVSFLKSFIRDSNGIKKLQVTKAADYCNNVLHCNPSVTYQMFTRNKEVSEWIDNYNSRVLKRVTLSDGSTSAVPDAQVNIDEAVRRCRDESGLRAFLADINSQVAQLSSIIHSLSRQSERLSEALAAEKAKNEALEGSLEAGRKSRDNELQKAKKELAAARKENAELRSRNRQMLEYVNRYVADGAIIGHAAEMGIIRHDEADLPELSEEALKAMGGGMEESMARFMDAVDVDSASGIDGQAPDTDDAGIQDDAALESDEAAGTGQAVPADAPDGQDAGTERAKPDAVFNKEEMDILQKMINL